MAWPSPSRLPRPRGDRPRWPICRIFRTAAPPPARGSTSPYRGLARRGRGSPARAGIDLLRGMLQDGVARLPRPRGDRPSLVTVTSPATVAPPPARGSTCSCVRVVPNSLGSPARAGIDRPSRLRWCAPRRLPRPRGDRPAQGRLWWVTSRAPPPARGSTADCRGEQRRQGGSPARAGIDPWRALPRATLRGLPRPRGDRPYSPGWAKRCPPAPPPARGSTCP